VSPSTKGKLEFLAEYSSALLVFVKTGHANHSKKAGVDKHTLMVRTYISHYPLNKTAK